ncbi:hypothetical protein [Micropruina sp.]|uniref:hypothetical protein n=1 Tax=Micropruina sp. TaxID=2737536 RepID=UPI0039E5224F
MKRLVPLLLLLSACTVGQPAASTPPPVPEISLSAGATEAASPSATDSPSATPSGTGSTSPSPTPSESGSPSPSLTQSGSAGSFRAPGEVLDLNGEVTITVLDSKRATVNGHRGNQVLAMVKTCNVSAASGIELTWDNWVLLGPDSEEYPASTVHGSSEPTPSYPNGEGRLYKPGQCAKGWIVFDVPSGAQLSGVRYMNSLGDSAQWRLSASI